MNISHTVYPDEIIEHNRYFEELHAYFDKQNQIQEVIKERTYDDLKINRPLGFFRVNHSLKALHTEINEKIN